MDGDPFPVDGWHEDRGRWVRDLPDGSYLHIGMTHTERGWVVSEFSQICSR
jgi:hypothetical protein